MPTHSEIRAELKRRLDATERMINFAKFMSLGYVDEPMHHLIASHLDRVVSGEIQRLIITVPPQTGKSRLVSNLLPAYWFGKHPNDPIILSSYSASLAEFHSQRARDILESPEYKLLFPKTKIRADTRAKEFWLIDGQTDGGMLAVGVGGGITGHPAKLGLIDDPTSNDEEAQSQTMRDKVWDWFLKSFRSRIRPDGAQIVCMTRWHESDLVGRILNDPAISREGWVVLRIPALTETQEERDFNNRKLNLPIGEADPLGRTEEVSCSPVRWPTDHFKVLKAGSLLTWICLYQNAPIGIQGVVLQRELFQYLSVTPACSSYVRYWDKAGTENGGKYTAGVLLGYERALSGNGGRIVILDVVRGQWAASSREPVILETAEKDRKLYGAGVQIYVEQEGGSGGKESAENTIRMLVGFAAFSETVSGDKMTRAQPFIAQVMNKNVFLMVAPWNQAYVDEWVAIPNGRYMDQVDASSGALAHAVDIAPATQPSVSGERAQMSDAMKSLPNTFYRGVVRGGAIARYVNNRYVPVAPPHEDAPFGFAPKRHE